jgi:hypothetical protein
VAFLWNPAASVFPFAGSKIDMARAPLDVSGQYDPGLVQTEREGLLDDPTYIAGLPKDHPLKTRENVFAFSTSCAGMQMLQMLALSLAPLGQPNPGAQLYHFVGNITELPAYGSCHSECQFPSLVALGDDGGIPATAYGRHCSKRSVRPEHAQNLILMMGKERQVKISPLWEMGADVV